MGILESQCENVSDVARARRVSALKNTMEQTCAASGSFPRFPLGRQPSSFQFPDPPSNGLEWPGRRQNGVVLKCPGLGL